MSELVSIDKAAFRLGVSPWLVDLAIRNGNLRSQSFGVERRTTNRWIDAWLSGTATYRLVPTSGAR